MAKLFRVRAVLKMLLALCLLVSSITNPSVDARIRQHQWDVKYENKSPDCFQKLVLTVNGQFPGPTIRAEQGDTIIVEVKNSVLSENVSIHWHGIQQKGTPWADGTEGVTQCSIEPGNTFIYQFLADRPGTYLYHAHYGMQREAGLYGSIRVALRDGELEPFSYDYDRSIILTDWYHKSPAEFTWVSEPQSLLIQGKGRFDCCSTGVGNATVCNVNSTECSPFVLTVVPGRTYLLRIGCLTALSALSFQVEGHNMTVVEADGHYIEPFVVKNLFIYSGETYSVLIKTDQDPSRNYWIISKVVGRNSTTPNGLAFFNYSPNHPKKSPPTFPPTGPLWNDSAPRLNQSLAIKSHPGFIHPPPQTSDRVIVLLITQNKADGIMRWSVNNVSSNTEKSFHSFNQTLPPEDYGSTNSGTISNSIYRLQFNSTVDVILQNTKRISETHVWHLHGHEFWVLGSGYGKFNQSSDPQNYNLVNPIMKNTVPVHPSSWTALRFRADNPGAWAFHCHTGYRLDTGMGVVFEVGIDKVGKLPSSIMGCGDDTKRFSRP